MNLFKVPLGNVGKSFVGELSRLYNAFASGSALESIVLMAAIGCYMAVPVFERKKLCHLDSILCVRYRMASLSGSP